MTRLGIIVQGKRKDLRIINKYNDFSVSVSHSSECTSEREILQVEALSL